MYKVKKQYIGVQVSMYGDKPGNVTKVTLSDESSQEDLAKVYERAPEYITKDKKAK